jgi:hypothetical protein
MRGPPERSNARERARASEPRIAGGGKASPT